MTTQHSTTDRPLIRVGSLRPSLTPAQRRVADVVLASPDWVSANTITALATRCSASEATIIRFCKDVGYSGFPAFRHALTSDIARAETLDRTRIPNVDVTGHDTIADIVAKVGAADRDAIVDTTDTLNLDSLKATVDAIVDAQHVAIFGIGASGLVAEDLEAKLRRIGRSAVAATDGHEALTTASLLDSESMAMGISHSGETADVVEPMELAKRRGATTVGLTNYPRSPLTGVVNVVLVTAVVESRFRSGAMASRVAQLTIIDCIFVAVAQRDFDRTVTALDDTYNAIRSRRIGSKNPKAKTDKKNPRKEQD